MTREAGIGLAQAALAAALFSTGAILIRWAQELAPIEVASLRMLLGGVFVAVAARASGDRVAVTWAEIRRLVPIGLIAATHFFTFITALHYTTVAHALTLTYTAPLFIAALSRIFLKERVPRRAFLGILMGTAGVAVLAGFEPRLTRQMLAGDALGLASGLAFAIYSLMGRRERSRLPLLTYASWVFLAAGVSTAPFAVGVLCRPVGTGAIAAVIAMALFPSALGHSLYNAALRRLHPSIPNLIASQEVTGGILLAWVLLGEAPTLNAVAGAGMTLIAVALVLL